MELGMRVMQQINVSTSLTLVKFLSVGLNPLLSSLDTCVCSILIVMISRVLGTTNVLGVLSRRLAMLLIMEKVKPLLLDTLSGQHIFHIRGLMINTGVVSILAIVPPAWKQSTEAQVLTSAVIYMYADIFVFFSAWRDVHITVLAVCCVVSWAVNAYRPAADSSPILITILQIFSTANTSLVIAVIMSHVETKPDAAIFYLLLMFTIVHYSTIPAMNMSEDFMLYKVATIIQSFIFNDPWIWVGFLALASQLLTQWVGLRSGVTRVVILLLVNITVTVTVAYIKQLAVYDTIITLKTSALVVQFMLHELTLLTFVRSS